MSDIIWDLLIQMVGLIIPFLTIKIIFDYIRMFLFSKDS